MAVVDTSFLVAFFNRADRFHARAKETSLLGRHLLVPCEVWHEFCQTVTRGAAGPEVGGALEDAQHGPFDIRHATDPGQVGHWAVQAQLRQRALKAAGHSPLSLVDVVVCRLAQERKDEVLTFDGAMIHALRSRWFPGARAA